MNNNWKHNIVNFLIAQTVSLFGSSIVQYAAIWFITLTTSSGIMLTFSTICGFLPQILISLFAGVWIDRYDRKKIIMLSDAMIAFSTLVLALFFVSGFKNIWLIIIVLAIRSAGSGIQTPAVQSVIPQIVPEDNLMRINGIYSSISSIIMFLSPAISAFVLSIASFEAVLFIDIITAIIGISITATVSIKQINRSLQQTHIKEIKKSILYLKDHLFVKRSIFYQFVISFLITPSAFLTPLLVSRTFGSEVWYLSLTEMTYSLGMILGGILISYWGGFKKRIHTTILATLLYGTLMIAFGLTHIFIIYLIINTLIGITAPCYSTPLTVLIQENVEEDMLGRIFSFMQIAGSSAFPLGMILFGPLADIVPIQVLLLVCGTLVVVIAIYVKLTHYLDK